MRKTPDPVDIHVGERLRTIRMLRRMSQDQLAEQLGITFQQVQKYEKGANRLSASKMFHAARALGCTVPDFFAGLETIETDPVPMASAETIRLGAKLDRLDAGTRAAITRVVDAVIAARADGDKRHRDSEAAA